MGIRDLFCVRCLLSRSFSSVLFVYPRPLEAGGSSVYLVSSVFVCSLMGGDCGPQSQLLPAVRTMMRAWGVGFVVAEGKSGKFYGKRSGRSHK